MSTDKVVSMSTSHSDDGDTATALRLLASRGTASVSDALDLLGAAGPVFGVRRMSGVGAVVGPAFTVEFQAAVPHERAPAADFIDDVPPGAVVVIGNAGPHCTVWGDILAEVATRRGVAGTVIDGLCRDVDAIRAIDYSVWAQGAFMRSGKNRVKLRAVQVPITLGAGTDTVTVHPGDVVCADGSGVVAVAQSLLVPVLDRVRAIVEMEDAVLSDVAAGQPLREARSRHGYDEVARRLDGSPR